MIGKLDNRESTEFFRLTLYGILVFFILPFTLQDTILIIYDQFHYRNSIPEVGLSKMDLFEKLLI